MIWTTVNSEKDLPLDVEILVEYKQSNYHKHDVLMFFKDEDYGIVASIYEGYVSYEKIKSFTLIKH